MACGSGRHAPAAVSSLGSARRAGVAQWIRAPDFGSGCRGFESLRRYQTLPIAAFRFNRHHFCSRSPGRRNPPLEASGCGLRAFSENQRETDNGPEASYRGLSGLVAREAPTFAAHRQELLRLRPRNVLVPWCAAYAIDQVEGLTDRQVDQFSMDLEERKNRAGEALHVPTRVAYLKALRHFLAWAHDEAQIDCQPDRVGLPRLRRLEKDVLSEQEMQELEDAASNERDKLLIRVMAETGGRIGEIAALHVDDLVERERRYWFVRLTGQDRTAPCTDLRRTVPPLARLQPGQERSSTGEVHSVLLSPASVGQVATMSPSPSPASTAPSATRPIVPPSTANGSTLTCCAPPQSRGCAPRECTPRWSPRSPE